MPAEALTPGLSAKPPAQPPPVGRQVAQLVVIPALITVCCISVLLLFGWLAGRPDRIEDQLDRLAQSSGAGRLGLGVQDPRYLERRRAAASLALRLPDIKDPRQQAEISRQLLAVLTTHIGPDEAELEAVVVGALGVLGQADALPHLLERADSRHEIVRQYVVRAAMAWPDGRQARQALPAIIKLLKDPSPVVRAIAAAAAGALASADDEAVLTALHQALDEPGTAFLDAYCNAAIALAKLGDDRGAEVVGSLLLNRAALTQMVARELPPGTSQTRLDDRATRILLQTLASAQPMTNRTVWDKIRHLADHDGNVAVRSAARKLARPSD